MSFVRTDIYPGSKVAHVKLPSWVFRKFQEEEELDGYPLLARVVLALHELRVIPTDSHPFMFLRVPEEDAWLLRLFWREFPEVQGLAPIPILMEPTTHLPSANGELPGGVLGRLPVDWSQEAASWESDSDGRLGGLREKGRGSRVKCFLAPRAWFARFPGESLAADFLRVAVPAKLRGCAIVDYLAYDTQTDGVCGHVFHESFEFVPPHEEMEQIRRA